MATVTTPLLRVGPLFDSRGSPRGGIFATSHTYVLLFQTPVVLAAIVGFHIPGVYLGFLGFADLLGLLSSACLLFAAISLFERHGLTLHTAWVRAFPKGVGHLLRAVFALAVVICTICSTVFSATLGPVEHVLAFSAPGTEIEASTVFSWTLVWALQLGNDEQGDDAEAAEFSPAKNLSFAYAVVLILVFIVLPSLALCQCARCAVPTIAISAIHCICLTILTMFIAVGNHIVFAPAFVWDGMKSRWSSSAMTCSSNLLLNTDNAMLCGLGPPVFLFGLLAWDVSQSLDRPTPPTPTSPTAFVGHFVAGAVTAMLLNLVLQGATAAGPPGHYRHREWLPATVIPFGYLALHIAMVFAVVGPYMPSQSGFCSKLLQLLLGGLFCYAVPCFIGLSFSEFDFPQRPGGNPVGSNVWGTASSYSQVAAYFFLLLLLGRLWWLWSTPTSGRVQTDPITNASTTNGAALQRAEPSRPQPTARPRSVTAAFMFGTAYALWVSISLQSVVSQF